MSLTVTNPSFDKVYTMHAWRDNNIRLVLTQGEGLTASDGTVAHVKAPKFQLRDERGVIDLTSCEVSLALTRPDGSEDLLACSSASGEAAQGIISCPITASATSIFGDATGEIRVYSTNGTIKFYGVHAIIYRGVSDDAAAQSTQFSALVSALQKVGAITPEGTVVMDEIIAENGTNPVASGVIYDALCGKLDDSNGAVKTSNLNNGSVTSEKIAGNAIITDKIADSSVTTAKVADNSVTMAKLSTGARDSINEKVDNEDFDKATKVKVDGEFDYKFAQPVIGRAITYGAEVIKTGVDASRYCITSTFFNIEQIKRFVVTNSYTSGTLFYTYYSDNNGESYISINGSSSTAFGRNDAGTDQTSRFKNAASRYGAKFVRFYGYLSSGFNQDCTPFTNWFKVYTDYQDLVDLRIPFPFRGAVNAINSGYRESLHCHFEDSNQNEISAADIESINLSEHPDALENITLVLDDNMPTYAENMVYAGIKECCLTVEIQPDVSEMYDSGGGGRHLYYDSVPSAEECHMFPTPRQIKIIQDHYKTQYGLDINHLKIHLTHLKNYGGTGSYYILRYGYINEDGDYEPSGSGANDRRNYLCTNNIVLSQIKSITFSNPTFSTFADNSGTPQRDENGTIVMHKFAELIENDNVRNVYLGSETVSFQGDEDITINANAFEDVTLDNVSYSVNSIRIVYHNSVDKVNEDVMKKRVIINKDFDFEVLRGQIQNATGKIINKTSSLYSYAPEFFDVSKAKIDIYANEGNVYVHEYDEFGNYLQYKTYAATKSASDLQFDANTKYFRVNYSNGNGVSNEKFKNRVTITIDKDGFNDFYHVFESYRGCAQNKLSELSALGAQFKWIGVFNEYPQAAMSWMTDNITWCNDVVSAYGNVLLEGIREQRIGDDFLDAVDGYSPHVYTAVGCGISYDFTDHEFAVRRLMEADVYASIKRWILRTDKPVIIGEGGCCSNWNALRYPEATFKSSEYTYDANGKPQAFYLGAVIDAYRKLPIVGWTQWWGLSGSAGTARIKRYMERGV